MTYKIAIANEKGGVAKTTTTISLGAVLAEMGNRVLLIDLDPQANLSLALGIDPAGVQNSSARLLIEGLPLASVVASTNIPNLDLVPGNSEMGMAERFLTNRKGYETILRGALEKAAQPYDYVLMDCPPFIGAVTLNALNSVDLLLIPTQAEYFSIYALRNLMNLIRRVRAQSNPRLTYRLALTMFDRRNRIHRSLSEQLRTSFNTGVMQTVIEVDTKLRESPIAGVSILQHAPKSRAAAQYHALAQEIIDYVKETNQQPA